VQSLPLIHHQDHSRYGAKYQVDRPIRETPPKRPKRAEPGHAPLRGVFAWRRPPFSVSGDHVRRSTGRNAPSRLAEGFDSSRSGRNERN